MRDGRPVLPTRTAELLQGQVIYAIRCRGMVRSGRKCRQATKRYPSSSCTTGQNLYVVRNGMWWKVVSRTRSPAAR